MAGGGAAVQSIYLPKCQVDLEVEVDLAMTIRASLVMEVVVDMWLNLHFLSERLKILDNCFTWFFLGEAWCWDEIEIS